MMGLGTGHRCGSSRTRRCKARRHLLRPRSLRRGQQDKGHVPACGTSSAMARPGKEQSQPSAPPREYRRGGEGTGHAASQGRRAGGSRSRCSTPGQKQETKRAWDSAQVSLLPLTAQGWGLQPRHPNRRGQERPQKWGLGSEHPQPSLAAFPSRGKWRPEGTSTACCGRDVSAPRILQHSGLSIKTNIKKT